MSLDGHLVIMHGDGRGATIGVKSKNTACFSDALREARHNHHRILIVLSGSRAWCKKIADAWYAAAKQRVWIGDTSKYIDAISAAKAKQVLGSEYSLAVLDAHAGLSPDCLAAVSGTVVAGGVLVLLTPVWDQWGTVPDLDYVRLASYPHEVSSLSSYFLLHIKKSVAEFSENSTVVFHWRQGCERDDALLHLSHAFDFSALDAVKKTDTPTVAQQRCLEQLMLHSGISVLFADRGCGKSATLGFAAAAWKKKGKSVLLVAPSRTAARSVFRYAGSDLPFCAPDYLLADATITADMLLIDEAAAIPLSMLFALLARFPHVVLATTTDGYEGTGQGFVLRFLRELDRRFLSWQRLVLDAPMRWAADDPLSHWLYATLLLDAKEPVFAERDNDLPLTFELVSQQCLSQNKILLREIYGLLRSAHYRTTPDDLRFLLDAPTVSLYRLVRHAQTLAVALLIEEGSLDAEMAEEIAAGRRRPRGHLLVQSLAVHLQQPQFLQQRVSRVVRIAVHTQYQSQGLGSQLLQAILQEQKKCGVCAVGSSFSAAPDVLRFWQKNGFELLRVGHRRQAASAEPSALVLKVF